MDQKPRSDRGYRVTIDPRIIFHPGRRFRRDDDPIGRGFHPEWRFAHGDDPARRSIHGRYSTPGGGSAGTTIPLGGDSTRNGDLPMATIPKRRPAGRLCRVAPQPHRHSGLPIVPGRNPHPPIVPHGRTVIPMRVSANGRISQIPCHIPIVPHTPSPAWISAPKT